MADKSKLARILERAGRAIVKVGGGRGFVVGDDHRYVITAAHCLPHLPPALSFSSSRECTYQALLGPLGHEPSVSVECVFVDPIADIAVLGPPDVDDVDAEADVYLERHAMLRIGDIPATPNPSEPVLTDLWLMGLDGRWLQCSGSTLGKGIWTTRPGKGDFGGLSGSPLLTRDGKAAAVFVAGGDDDDDELLERFPGDGP